MTAQLIDGLLDEGKWLPIAMALSAVGAAILFIRLRALGSSRRARTQAALNLFYGCMIGIMAGGHLFAVTIGTARGTSTGSPWFLVLVGLALAVPAWWLANDARSGQRKERHASMLNGCLVVVLLLLGLHNWPLAAPGLLNIGHAVHSRPAVGRTVIAVALAGYLALFVGSLLFLASGQTFEQFMGIE